jgi:hypothetical protein
MGFPYRRKLRYQSLDSWICQLSNNEEMSKRARGVASGAWHMPVYNYTIKIIIYRNKIISLIIMIKSTILYVAHAIILLFVKYKLP